MRDTATDTTETVAPGWPDNAMLEAAWGIIANAGGGNWETQTPEWQAAAIRWREAYHRALAEAALLARRAPGDREIVLTADDREAIVDALVDAGMLGTLERWRRALAADSRPEQPEKPR